MAAASTSTTYDPVIRELWPQKRINNLVFQDRPLLAMMQKKTDFNEKKRHIALRHNTGQGASQNFSKAKSNASSSKYKDFELTIASEHYYGTLDGLLLERTQSDKAALVTALDEETEGSLETLAQILNEDLFGDGSGSLGTISNATPTTSITLSDTEDIAAFHEDMVLVFASSATGSVRQDSSSDNTAKVTAVDTNDGVLTLDTNLTTYTDQPAQNDHIFRQGDAQNGASDPARVVGLDGWIPDSDPGTSDDFFGVNRSKNVTKLAGVRYDGSTDGSIEEALIKAAQRMKREGTGAKPDTIIISPSDMAELIVELGNKLQRENVPAPEATIGFDAVVLKTPAGTMKIMDDQGCPVGVAYMLRMNTWTLHSLDVAPRPWSLDGRETLRLSDEDGLEHRSVYRAQIGCDAPGWNARVTLPS